MSTGEPSPQRELTLSAHTPLPPSTVPQKRALEDDHQPAVSSPLNPDFRATPRPSDDNTVPSSRERVARSKKETLKKREAKGSEPSGRSTPDPKASATTQAKNKKTNGAATTMTPLRYKLPPPRASDFDAPRGPVFMANHVKISGEGQKIHFNETSDHVYNKKNFHYTHCIADPQFPSSLYYRQSDAEPYKPRFNFEDTATHMFLDETAQHVTTDKGFRMAKANVGVRQGRWYWECRVTSGIPKRKRDGPEENPRGHVRMGWARREATLDAPVGFDAYSYGLRDVAGQKVWMSRPKDFFPAGEDIREGDVIGLEINLPSEALHRKVVEGHYNPAVDLVDDEVPSIETADIIRDRVPIRFKAHLYFEQIEYHAVKELEELMNPSPVITSSGVNVPSQEPSPTHANPSLRTLPHSCIKIYRNGELIGTPFTDLLTFLPPASKPLAQVGARDGLDDGMLGYYPAVSVFRGGAAEVNFGPDFWYPPPGYGGDAEDVDMIGSDSNEKLSPARELRELRAVGERYHEQIAEDIVYDIIDEVDFWVQDGGVTGKAATNGVLRAPNVAISNVDGAAGDVSSEEIKELVQDEE